MSDKYKEQKNEIVNIERIERISRRVQRAQKSQLGFVTAGLLADLQVRHTNPNLTPGEGDGVAAKNPQKSDPTRNPSVDIDGDLPGEDVSDEVPEHGPKPLDLEHERAVEDLGAPGRNVPRGDVDVADLDPPVEDLGAAGGVAEAGAVGVVDGDPGGEGEVEAEGEGGEGDGGGDAGDVGGEEGGGGVLGFEEGEVEDEAQEEEE
ncbi:hypothetical protein Sjap_006090 [Stephania japonica]|uniref:Uncharacterized protein n=1 Tax=Stephania japonica TaxID=461633 RepID=A0AAP0K5A2_9MAGN